jgi:hypothetical protein
LCFEVFFELLTMLGHLKTLMMVQHQRHPVFIGDLALVEKISEARLVRRKRQVGDVELSENACDPLNDVGTIVPFVTPWLGENACWVDER